MKYKEYVIHLTPDNSFSGKKGEGYTIEILNSTGLVKCFRSPFATYTEAEAEAKRAIGRGVKPGLYQ